MMIGRQAVIGFGHRDELHRHEDGALVQQLEDGMLGIGARPSPGDGAVGWPTGEPPSVTDLPFDSISSCWR